MVRRYRYSPTSPTTSRSCVDSARIPQSSPATTGVPRSPLRRRRCALTCSLESRCWAFRTRLAQRAPPAFPEDCYVAHFQTPGVAETEIEADVASWLRRFNAALPDGTPGWFAAPRHLPDAPLLEWAPELDAITAGFERTGSPARSTASATSPATRRTSPPSTTASADHLHQRRTRQREAALPSSGDALAAGGQTAFRGEAGLTQPPAR